MRIVYKWNGTGIIAFPIGPLSIGGTCEFATDKCLEECAEPKDKAYDTIYKIVTTLAPIVVSRKIIRDMSEIGVNILSWFATGDCPTKDQEHILKIIDRLSLVGIVQHGFTRNLYFWKALQKIDNGHFCLTVETEEEKDKYVKFGMVAIPQYFTGIIHLYKMEKHDIIKKVRHVGSCSGIFYEDEKVGEGIREAHCSICYEKLEGCFTLFDGDK